MKAITLHQPWATLVAEGAKTLETRSWSTRYRGPLAIHAGMRRPRPGVACNGMVSHSSLRYVDRVEHRWHWKAWRDDAPLLGLPLGAIVATCTLADVVPMVDRWLHGRLIAPTEPCLTIEPCHLLLVTPGAWTEMEHERPYGDFRPGRYAWVLEDVKAIEPVPTRGWQGLWSWDG